MQVTMDSQNKVIDWLFGLISVVVVDRRQGMSSWEFSRFKRIFLSMWKGVFFAPHARIACATRDHGFVSHLKEGESEAVTAIGQGRARDNTRNGQARKPLRHQGWPHNKAWWLHPFAMTPHVISISRSLALCHPKETTVLSLGRAAYCQ